MPMRTKLAWQIPLMPGATQRVSVGKNRTGNCWIKSGLCDQICLDTRSYAYSLCDLLHYRTSFRCRFFIFKVGKIIVPTVVMSLRGDDSAKLSAQSLENY